MFQQSLASRRGQTDSFAGRTRSALRRRLYHAWRRLTGNERRSHAADAWHWLTQQAACAHGGLPFLAGHHAGHCGLTASALPVLAAFGQRQLVDELLAWLLAAQGSDGAFADAAGRPCCITTGQVLAGLLTLLDDCNATGDCRLPLEIAVTQASRYLVAADHVPIDAPGSLANWASPALSLISHAALFKVGQRCHESGWRDAALHAAGRLRRTRDVTNWNMPTHHFVPVVQAMLDLEWHEDAQRAMTLPAALQTASGDVPALPDAGWVSSSGLAQLAACWYRMNEPERADAALAALNKQQQPDGGFPGSWGRGAVYYPQRQTVATAWFALEAAIGQVAASFAHRGDAQDDELSPDDGRLIAVKNFLAGLPNGSRVADVGCGSGRYLQLLRPWFPQYRWTGIDASANALKHLPPGIESVKASMLNLSANEGSCDAAYCVEALEHSLLPEQAVAELCRIVRPGGRVLVVDKQRSFQPLSEHHPWELWFAPDEVRQWMSPFCDEIQCQPIAHGAHQKPTGLFLCWTARRKISSVQQRAA